MVVTSLSLSIGGDPSVGKGREAGWVWAWTRSFCHFLALDLPPLLGGFLVCIKGPLTAFS